MKKEEQTEAYKIVKTDFTSLNMHNIDFLTKSKYELSYELDKTTQEVPETVGIMCFDTLESADKFLRSFIRPWTEHCIILKVKGTKKKIQANEICGYCYDKKLDYFYGSESCFRMVISMIPPSGTVFFKEVTPIEIVKEHVA